MDSTSYQSAVADLSEASEAYRTGITVSPMSDAEYDALLAEITDYEQSNPSDAIDHALHTVGEGTSGDTPHAAPMLSLEKVHSTGAASAWVSKAKAAAGRFGDRVVVEPKLDGIAVAATYEDGRLVRVVTRGNGIAGEDVTDRLGDVLGLPLTCDIGDNEVRGEIVFNSDQFAVANRLRVAAGKEMFANRRNGVAGTVRKDAPGAERPEMSFYAYGATGKVSDTPGYTNDMRSLDALGFNPVYTAPEFQTTNLTPGGLDGELAHIEQMRTMPVPFVEMDGAVIKMDDERAREALGEGNRHPRWAVALKFAAEEVTTTLLDIEVSVGRTGLHALRGRVAPVEVAGVTVEYATLHNPSDLIERDVRPGDTVIVRRAGDVIPEIVRHTERPADSRPWIMPSECIACGSELDQTSKRWKCENDECVGGSAALLAYACGRDALDIEGAGQSTVEALLAHGLLDGIDGLATLTVSDVARLPGFGISSARSLIDEIAKAKSQPLARLVIALGIPMTGRSMSRTLAQHFGTMDALLAASTDDLQTVAAVGDRRAEVIHRALRRLHPTIVTLAEQGWNMTDESYGQTPLDTSGGPLGGLKVVVSGKVPGLSRAEAQELVVRLGGETSGSVSKTTSVLVSGEGAGGKFSKAKALGVRIESPEWLLALADG